MGRGGEACHVEVCHRLIIAASPPAPDSHPHASGTHLRAALAAVVAAGFGALGLGRYLKNAAAAAALALPCTPPHTQHLDTWQSQTAPSLSPPHKQVPGSSPPLFPLMTLTHSSSCP